MDQIVVKSDKPVPKWVTDNKDLIAERIKQLQTEPGKADKVA